MKHVRCASSGLIRILVPASLFLTIIVGLLAASSGRQNHRQEPLASAPDPVLAPLLARAAEYCDRLESSVLNFVCREKIEEWTRSSVRRMGLAFVGPREKHRYLYDYQLARDREGLCEERRTLLKDDGKEVSVSGAPLKTRSFSHGKVVEGPLGLLRREVQAVHDYSIVGQEKALGEEAAVIEVVPKPGAAAGGLYGKAWLRKSDAGILRIEWTPGSIGNYKTIEEQAERLEMTPACVFISEYAFEKNGVRFPSRFVAKEIYRRKSGIMAQLAQVDVVYDEYKFFTVETKVDIRSGGQRP
jgi:hypothetical protein